MTNPRWSACYEQRQNKKELRDQFCVLIDHLNDAPQVVVSLGGEEIVIEKFGPGEGAKAGHAKWWGEWNR
jgi:hypothetical protein